PIISVKIRARLDAAEPGTQRAQVDEAVVAIASGGAREEGKVAIAGGVNIRLAFDVMVTIVIVIRHLADKAAVALGAHDLGVQQHLHADFTADFVKRELHRLAVDGKKHAAKLYRAACAPDLTEFLDNLSGDAQHCRPRVVADGVEATKGLHTLQRSRPTKTAGALDHQRAGRGPRGADRRSGASGTAADHYDIVALDVVRHANYTLTLVSQIRG